MRVEIVIIDGAEPNVTVERQITLTLTAGTSTEQAALMARELLTVDERDAVRAKFGIVPLSVDPSLAPWDDVMAPTVEALLEGSVPVVDLTDGALVQG